MDKNSKGRNKLVICRGYDYLHRKSKIIWIIYLKNVILKHIHTIVRSQKNHSDNPK